MSEAERTADIKKTLRDIFCYIGCDESYADDATVQTYMEWFAARQEAHDDG